MNKTARKATARELAADEEIPEGWAIARLPDIAEIIMGQSPPGSSYNKSGSGLPFFQGKADFGARFPTARAWCTEPTRVAQPGDILISVRAPVGPTNLANQQCAIGRGLSAIRPSGGVPSLFMLYALRLQEADLAEKGTGSTFTAINRGDLEAVSFPLPPLAEQKRIVAKVEELLARVDAARERLARVPAILRRFRQAILSAACEGKLTEEWRGRRGVTKPWRKLPLSELLAEPMANGHSVPDATSGFPVLRLTALRGGSVDLRERKIGAWTRREAERFLVKRGDFLVARGNGSLALVGRGGLVESEPDAVAYPDTMIRVRPRADIIDVHYLRLVWNADEVRRQIEGAAHTTAGIHKVSQKDLNEIELPVPPPEEQAEIVHRVEALFKLADAIEKRVSAATARAEKLTQAILAKAFRGELVPTETDRARRKT